MSREFENYVRRLARPPSQQARSSPLGRRAVPSSGQGAGDPQQAVGSSPKVVRNIFDGNPEGEFVDRGVGQINTNITSWRLAEPPQRQLGFTRFSETGLRADLTPKGEPEMRFRIITYAS